jgi:hypothetical protein
MERPKKRIRYNQVPPPVPYGPPDDFSRLPEPVLEKILIQWDSPRALLELVLLSEWTRGRVLARICRNIRLGILEPNPLALVWRLIRLTYRPCPPPCLESAPKKQKKPSRRKLFSPTDLRELFKVLKKVHPYNSWDCVPHESSRERGGRSKYNEDEKRHIWDPSEPIDNVPGLYNSSTFWLFGKSDDAMNNSVWRFSQWMEEHTGICSENAHFLAWKLDYMWMHRRRPSFWGHNLGALILGNEVQPLKGSKNRWFEVVWNNEYVCWEVHKQRNHLGIEWIQEVDLDMNPIGKPVPKTPPFMKRNACCRGKVWLKEYDKDM